MYCYQGKNVSTSYSEKKKTNLGDFKFGTFSLCICKSFVSIPNLIGAFVYYIYF